jgi:hypothetical protein
LVRQGARSVTIVWVIDILDPYGKDFLLELPVEFYIHALLAIEN